MTILDSTASVLEADIRNYLRQFGLDGLASWAAGQVGVSGDEFIVALEQQPLYRERFAPVFERREQIARGEATVPLTPDAVLESEMRDRELEQEFGLPENSIDTHARLVGDVSQAEMRERVQIAVEDAMDVYADEAGRAFLDAEFARNPGLSEGGIVSLFLDPDVALPRLKDQVRAASVAVGANASGFRLTNAEATRLADQDVTQEQARQAFGELDGAQELTGGITGDQERFTRDEIIGLAGGDPILRNRLERTARRRVAEFSGGGGFSGGTRGLA